MVLLYNEAAYRFREGLELSLGRLPPPSKKTSSQKINHPLKKTFSLRIKIKNGGSTFKQPSSFQNYSQEASRGIAASNLYNVNKHTCIIYWQASYLNSFINLGNI